MRVIVAGGRDFNNYELMCTTLDYYLRDLDKSELVIVSGDGPGNPGADKLAIKYAKERGYQLRTYPPNWGKYGNPAGPIRNRQMAENADALVAFPGGRGTKNMIETAKELDLNIRIVNY